eukprot:TRINITY_DN8215_c0_g1_i1.p2 TRINITY_DN8215_c0_g1~~TRINITY_DN8215_c0_g1_i1.p2  ORF type:complete len:247 (+),score=42.82 TRINITY_DN8215_c0_g1_i1:34-741(+)
MSGSDPGVGVRIGVLALQGAFHEHIVALSSLPGVTAVPVRTAKELENVDGLILPGGESTAIALIGEGTGIFEELRRWVQQDRKPTWGTCAGCIMMANNVHGQKEGGQQLIGGMDIIAHRNFFGRQMNSFEMPIHISLPDQEGPAPPFPGVFIRAPAILGISSSDKADEVRVLARLQVPSSSLKDPLLCDLVQDESVIVAAQQGACLVTVFHPELTEDTRIHEYFLDIVKKHKARE